MKNRAIMVVLVAAGLAGAAILLLWQRVPYTDERHLARTPSKPIPPDAPRIEFDEREIDFGETMPVPQIEGTFVVRNAGKSLLRIEPPQPSCGCTVSSLTTNQLSPGSQARLDFTLSLNEMWAGDIHKTITILSNDPLNSNVVLKIKGRIKPFVEITPREIALGNLYIQSATNVSAVIRRLDGKDLHITNVVTSPLIKAKAVPISGSHGPEVRLEMEIRGAGKPRWIGEGVGIFSDDATIAQPIGVVTVNGRLTDLLVVTPEQLYWSIPTGADWSTLTSLQERRLLVESLQPDQSFKLLDLKANILGLEFKKDPAKEEGAAHEILVRLARAPAQSATGSIVIHTDHPKVPTVEVPFSVYVPPKR